MKITINVDDFGISPGVNQAVLEMFKAGKITSASLMCGCGYFDQAIKIAKENPNLKIGLHFNLSSGRSILDSKLLTDDSGNFKNGFVKIFLQIIFNQKKFLAEVKKELEAQISLIEKSGLKLEHINSHRHIHFIPKIFDLVVKAASNHNISKVRVINESLIKSWKIGHKKTFLFDGGLIKLLILRICGLLNNSKNYPNPSYFFSILYTCKISKELISKLIPKDNSSKNLSDTNFSEIEIMIHPANPDLDSKIDSLEEKDHLLSANRLVERL
ncbi:MAG: hypothetical protein ACJAZX_001179 [Rickettsiales bacterium]|jgi:hypothetical protein